MKARLFRAFIKLPIIRSIAAKELKTFDDAIVKHCRSIYKEEKFMLELQRKGLNEGDILKKLKTYQDLSNVQWRNGRVSGQFVIDHFVYSTNNISICFEMYRCGLFQFDTRDIFNRSKRL